MICECATTHENVIHLYYRGTGGSGLLLFFIIFFRLGSGLLMSAGPPSLYTLDHKPCDVTNYIEVLILS